MRLSRKLAKTRETNAKRKLQRQKRDEKEEAATQRARQRLKRSAADDAEEVSPDDMRPTQTKKSKRYVHEHKHAFVQCHVTLRVCQVVPQHKQNMLGMSGTTKSKKKEAT